MADWAILADWATRGGVAVFYFIFGIEKFSSSLESHWVTLLQQIHAGEFGYTQNPWPRSISAQTDFSSNYLDAFKVGLAEQ